MIGDHIAYFRQEADTSPLRDANIRGDELEQLIAPVPLAELPAIFGKQARLARGEPGSRPRLMSRERLRTLLQGDLTAARIHAHLRTDQYAHNLVEVRGDQVGFMLDSGSSVCITGIHRIEPSLLPFLAALKAQMGFFGRVGINGYLSPDGAGFELHWDCKSSIIVQLEGKKRWRYSEAPAVPHPLRAMKVVKGELFVDDPPLHSWERVPRPDPASLSEVLLAPGDVLLLPGGCWHTARAEGVSLALNIQFIEPGVFPPMIWRAVRSLVADQPEWRAGPPIMPIDNHGEVHDYLDARLLELEAAVRRLREDDEALWQAFYSEVLTVPGSQPLPLSARARVKRDSHLMLRPGHPALIRQGVDNEGSDTVFIYQGPHTVCLFPSMLAVAERICTGQPFVASDLAALVPSGRWEPLEQVLQALAGEGMIVETEGH